MYYAVLSFIFSLIIGIFFLDKWRFQRQQLLLQTQFQDLKLELAVAKEKLQESAGLKQKLEDAQEQCSFLKEKLLLSQKDLEAFSKLGEEQQKLYEEKLRFLDEAKGKLSESFKAITHEVLQKQQSSFLLSAKENFTQLKQSSSDELEEKKKAIKDFVGDLKQALKDVNEKVDGLERGRVKAYTSLEGQLEMLQHAHRDLKQETQELVSTLKAPQQRGCWGEIQLKRILELSGMLNHCDFIEQGVLENEDKKLRPDILVTLPNNRHIIIDAKAPMQAFLEALEEKNEKKKKQHLEKHVKVLKRHLQQLSSKEYWQPFSSSPEFVVMFLPGETLWVSALQSDPALVELSMAKKIVVATPSTLMALLRSVAYGWSQNQLTEHAREIAILGKELYKRLGTLSGHFQEMKKGLDKAFSAYNQAMGSYETRVMGCAKKFEKLGIQEDKKLSLSSS